jgi:DNA segregation ATPase FtsK/SpoIIIE, S-DNA-T family
MIERRLTPIVVTVDGTEHDVVVEHSAPHTRADLGAALGCSLTTVGSAPLELEPGEHVGSDVFDASREPALPSRLVLAVVGGVNSGTTIALPKNQIVIGRDSAADAALDDPSVSRRHATIDIANGMAIRDLESSNGTFLNELEVDTNAAFGEKDIIRVGAVELQVRKPIPEDRPIGLAVTGATRFNRPPRHVRSPALGRIVPPIPPSPLVGRAPFRIGALIVPLLFAVAMVLLTKQILFAAFAAMSPVMMVVNTISDRRSNRDRSRRDAARFRAELSTFAVQLQAASHVARARREEVFPDLAETLRRAELPSRRLWERRPEHADFLRARIGRGTLPWSPPLDGEIVLGATEVDAILNRCAHLSNAVVDVDLQRGSILGVSGPRSSSLALVRAVLAQSVVHQGPADLQMVIATDADRLSNWDWTKWLPHIDRALNVAVGADEISVLAKSFLAASESRAQPVGAHREPTTLVILDVDPSTLTKLPVLRSWLEHSGRPCSIVVLAPTLDALPSSCTTVVALASTGAPLARMTELRTGQITTGILINGLSEPDATKLARSLCRYTDPETKVLGASLPSLVSLSTLLGLECETGSTAVAAELENRWSATQFAAPRPAAIGVCEHGPLTIDLAADGPHGLIGGTTGAGKSELLRSMVLSLALQSSPEELTFVLIDYKGGSAFDECAKLPHVVGMVTDLDEALSARAVICMEAELRYREQLLRSAGASDRDSYVRMQSPSGPLPRLAIVVDEFAALKNELPEFIDALVDVAQRGRSLGVHLLLATQRPAGVVSDMIRANTELKISLRMQETSDSTDVIGTPDAAFLPRQRHGMALVRFGSEAPVAFQAAYTGGIVSSTVPPVVVRPFRLRDASTVVAGTSKATGATELEVLVAAARQAHLLRGGVTPRRPWPEPLPDEIAMSELCLEAKAQEVCGTTISVLPVGITDEPERQARGALGWHLDLGNLLLIGARRSDTSAALASVAASLASTNGPDVLHIYGVKSQGSALDSLVDLSHIGEIVAISDRPKLLRLIRELSAELARRSSGAPSASAPVVVVLIDGVGSLKLELDDPTQAVSPWDQLMRVLLEGPRVGIVSALTIDRPSLVSGPLAAVAEQRWLFSLTDRLDYSLFGIRGSDVPMLNTLRCVDAQTSLVAQIANVDSITLEAARAWGLPEASSRASRIQLLPSTVTPEDLDDADLEQRPWSLPVGISDGALDSANVPLHAGEHLLVAGPSRSGRTSLLASIAAKVERYAHVVVVSPSRSALAGLAPHAVALRPDQVDQISMLIEGADGPVVVLIDDAELIDDPQGHLARLIADEHDSLFVAVAVRPELLRANYGHWSRQLRRTRLAVLLRPTDIDAEFVGATIPRRGLPVEPGRGYLCQNGQVELVQFATATAKLENDLPVAA